HVADDDALRRIFARLVAEQLARDRVDGHGVDREEHAVDTQDVRGPRELVRLAALEPRLQPPVVAAEQIAVDAERGGPRLERVPVVLRVGKVAVPGPEDLAELVDADSRDAFLEHPLAHDLGQERILAVDGRVPDAHQMRIARTVVLVRLRLAGEHVAEDPRPIVRLELQTYESVPALDLATVRTAGDGDTCVREPGTAHCRLDRAALGR